MAGERTSLACILRHNYVWHTGSRLRLAT